jgi:hypothetical protein
MASIIGFRSTSSKTEWEPQNKPGFRGSGVQDYKVCELVHVSKRLRLFMDLIMESFVAHNLVDVSASVYSQLSAVVF